MVEFLSSDMLDGFLNPRDYQNPTSEGLIVSAFAMGFPKITTANMHAWQSIKKDTH